MPFPAGHRHRWRSAGGERLCQRVDRLPAPRTFLPALRGDLSDRPDVRRHCRHFFRSDVWLEGDVHRRPRSGGPDDPIALVHVGIAALACVQGAVGRGRCHRGRAGACSAGGGQAPGAAGGRHGAGWRAARQ